MIALAEHAELIRRYDKSGPRYTSYPTAAQFHADFTEAQYRAWAERTNVQQPARPLSLYFHLPFCDTVCFYCACNKIITKNRARAVPYLEHLFKEIEMHSKLFDRSRLVDQLHWGGGTPTFFDHGQMRALMAQIAKHFSLRTDDSGEYSIEVDPRRVQPDTVALLRELGFNRMSLGVQDFEPAVQQAVNRLQSEEETFAVITAAREHEFHSISVDLIYGLPHQSRDSFARTLDKIIQAKPDRLSVFNYAHLPQLFKSQRHINAEDLPSPAEKLRILHMTIERLTEAGYIDIGMDHFARPDDELAVAQRQGTLYRNFQGYSTHAGCDLIAMGVSAISNVGESFSQNVREIEPYYEAIDAGRLPIFRGFELSADDRLRRDVIMQLICNFTLDTAAMGVRHGIRFDEYFASEIAALQEMQKDDLVAWDGATLRVQPNGRLLIRNICMVFDRYLSRPAQHYSKVI